MNCLKKNRAIENQCLERKSGGDGTEIKEM